MHHRNNPWTIDWLKRYHKEEGLKSLKDRTESGRPSEIPEDIIYQINKELSNSKQVDEQ